MGERIQSRAYCKLKLERASKNVGGGGRRARYPAVGELDVAYGGVPREHLRQSRHPLVPDVVPGDAEVLDLGFVAAVLLRNLHPMCTTARGSPDVCGDNHTMNMIVRIMY